MSKPNPLQGATEFRLSPRKLRALECLLSQKKGESYQSVADRAGVHRTSLYRYLGDPVFFAALNTRIRDEFRLVRLAVNRSLFANAIGGDVASQRLFYQLSGLLSETVEFTNSPRNIESVATIDPDTLTPEAREILWREVQKFRAENPGANGEREPKDEPEIEADNSSSPASRFTLSDPTDKKNFAGGFEDDNSDGPETDMDAYSGIDTRPTNHPTNRPNLSLFDDMTPGTTEPAETPADDDLDGIDSALAGTSGATADFEEY